MPEQRWAQTVRQQLGLGRLLPLGGPADGAWIAERAAREVLAREADAVPGVRLGRLRIALADPASAARSAVPAPPSALPHGPLRVAAELAASPRLPLPEAAQRLREALLAAADTRLGLDVVAVDLRITDLVEEPARGAESGEPEHAGGPEEPPIGTGPAGDAEPADLAEAVVAVPGVTRLAPALGAFTRAIRVDDERRHVLVQVAASAGHRALDVALAVRAAVAARAGEPPGPVTVAVLLTAIDPVAVPAWPG